MTNEDENTTLREDLESSLNSLPTDEADSDEINNDDNTEEDSVVEENADETESPDEDSGIDQEGKEDDSDKSGTEEEVKNLDAPSHWSAEDRETFAAQNEDVKTYLLRRHNEMESGFTKKSQELAEQRKSVDALSEFMSKWEPHTSALGVPLVNGLDALLNNDRQLRNGTPEQKRQLVLQLAQQYGINLDTTPQIEDEYIDPQLQQMQDQINMLNGNELARKQADEQVVVSRQQSIQQEVQAASNAFKDEKDDTGDLKFPHFDTLKTDMGKLVGSGQAGTGSLGDQLETAYNKALWMNTDTREQLLANKQSSLKEESIKKQGKAAAQAKKSAKANKKGMNAKAEKPKALPSLRDDLAEQLKQAEAV